MATRRAASPRRPSPRRLVPETPGKFVRDVDWASPSLHNHQHHHHRASRSGRALDFGEGVARVPAATGTSATSAFGIAAGTAGSTSRSGLDSVAWRPPPSAGSEIGVRSASRSRSRTGTNSEAASRRNFSVGSGGGGGGGGGRYDEYEPPLQTRPPMSVSARPLPRPRKLGAVVRGRGVPAYSSVEQEQEEESESVARFFERPSAPTNTFQSRAPAGTDAAKKDAHARLALWQRQQLQQQQRAQTENSRDDLLLANSRAGLQARPIHSSTQLNEQTATPVNVQEPASSPGGNFADFATQPPRTQSDDVIGLDPNASLAALRQDFMARFRQEHQELAAALRRNRDNDVQAADDLRATIAEVSSAMRVLADLQRRVLSTVNAGEGIAYKAETQQLQEGQLGQSSDAELAETSGLNLSAMLRSHLSDHHGDEDNDEQSQDSLERELLHASSFAASAIAGSTSEGKGGSMVSPDRDWDLDLDLKGHSHDGSAAVATVAACRAAASSLHGRCQLLAQRLGGTLRILQRRQARLQRQLNGQDKVQKQLLNEQNSLAAARAELDEATEAVRLQEQLQEARAAEETTALIELRTKTQEEAAAALADLERGFGEEIAQHARSRKLHEEAEVQLRADRNMLRERSEALAAAQLRVETREAAMRETWQKQQAEDARLLSARLVTQQELREQENFLQHHRANLEDEAARVRDEAARLAIAQESVAAERGKLNARAQELSKMQVDAELQLRNALHTAEAVQQRANDELAQARAELAGAEAAHREELARRARQEVGREAKMEAEVAAERAGARVVALQELEKQRQEAVHEQAAWRKAEAKMRAELVQVRALAEQSKREALTEAEIREAAGRSEAAAAQENLRRQLGTELSDAQARLLAVEREAELLRTELTEAGALGAREAEEAAKARGALAAASQAAWHLHEDFKRIELEEDSLEIEQLQNSRISLEVAEPPWQQQQQQQAGTGGDSRTDAELNGVLGKSVHALESSLSGLAVAVGQSALATRRRYKAAVQMEKRLAEQNSELQSITKDEMHRIESMNHDLEARLEATERERARARSAYNDNLLRAQHEADAQVAREVALQRREIEQQLQDEVRQVAGRAKSELETLRHEVDTERSARLSVEAELATAWQDLASAKSAARRARSDKEALKTSLSLSRSQMEATESEASFAQDRAVALEQRVSSLQAGELALQQQLERSQSEANESREKTALEEQRLQFETELLARDKVSLEADLAGVRHDLALESQRLERKGAILKQLQASLAKTQAELSASSVDLTERHRAIVERSEELDQRELDITNREKEVQRRETDLVARERALKHEEDLWKAQQDAVASEHEAKLAEVENKIRHDEDRAAARATSTLSEAHRRTIKEIEDAAHRREVDQREAAARRETELQDLLKQAQAKAEAAAAQAARERELAADTASDELQQAQQAWAEARSAAEHAEYREERLRKREKEFDARLEHLDQQHNKRAKELQDILDAIEDRNTQLSRRQKEISTAEASLKRREQQWKKTHQEQLDSLESQRDRSAQWARERAKLAERAESAETRLVAAETELSQLRMERETASAKDATQTEEQLKVVSATEREDNKDRANSARSGGSDELLQTKLEATQQELETAREHLETKERARQALEAQLANDAARCRLLEAQNHSLLKELSLAQSAVSPSATAHSSSSSSSSSSRQHRNDTDSGELVDPALRLSQAMELDAKVLLPLGRQLRNALDAQRSELEHLRNSSAQSQREIAALRDSNESLRGSEESLQRSLISQAHSVRTSSPANSFERAATPEKSTSAPPSQSRSDPVTMAHLRSSPAPKPVMASAALKYSSPAAAVSLRAQLLELQQSIQETLDDSSNSGTDKQVEGRSGPLHGDASAREPMKNATPSTASERPTMGVSTTTPTTSLQPVDLAADGRSLAGGSALDDRPTDSINYAFVDQLAALTTARVLAAAHLSRLGNICKNLETEKRNAFESHLEVLREKQTAFFEEEQAIRQATDHAAAAAAAAAAASSRTTKDDGAYSAAAATQARLEQLHSQLSSFSDEVGDLLRKAKVAHGVQAEALAQSRRGSPATGNGARGDGGLGATGRPLPQDANEINGPSLLSSVYLRAASSTTEGGGEDDRHRRREWEESQFEDDAGAGGQVVGFNPESMGLQEDSLDGSDNLRSTDQLNNVTRTGATVENRGTRNLPRLQTSTAGPPHKDDDLDIEDLI